MLLAFKSPDWALRKEWGRKHGDKFVQGMAAFDKVLQGRPYVAGDAFSIADIAMWAALVHGSYSGVNIPADHAALVEWHARVSERPSVKNRSGKDLHPEDVARLGPLFAYLEGLPKAA
jgi:glutathione S-transferase